MFEQLLKHHILTNLIFLLVLVMGAITYLELPREQDPSVNFNWVQVRVFWAAASASDVERRITEPLENGIERVRDINFVSSSSREGISTILVRFADINDEQFDDRMADLRREIQAKSDELPEEVKFPDIVEISSSNAFPAATIVVWGRDQGIALQHAARNIRKDLARLESVDRVAASGDQDTEMQVKFLPKRLLGLGISPVDLANTVSAYFRDLAAGDITLGDQKWLLKLTGTSGDPSYLEGLPVLTAVGELPLRSVAEISRALQKPDELVRYDSKPAVLLSVFKKDNANNLELLDHIKKYIDEKNSLGSGVADIGLVLVDDQTVSTRAAIGVMERNALVGLVLVLLTTGFFLGFRIAFFVSIGIVFVVSGTFWVLGSVGQTLNVTVLLGIIISLGMLVDDAIVVTEAIYFNLRKGMDGVSAAMSALRETIAPVSTAVLTTIAAFLPLMLMPGVLGDFMKVVPIVVTIALLLSLVETFWMLPSHLAVLQPDLMSSGKAQSTRDRLNWRLRHVYTKLLIIVFRFRRRSVLAIAGLLFLAGLLIGSGLIRIDFFATDLYRLFYVNVEMPPGSSLAKTSSTLGIIEDVVKESLGEGEARGVVSYAGQQFTDRELLVGEEKGQVFVSLNPAISNSRTVDQIIVDITQAVSAVPGPQHVSFLRRKTGPPTAKPVSIKVRGDDIAMIRDAVSRLKELLAETSGVWGVTDDDIGGGMELNVRLDPHAVMQANLEPSSVIRVIRLFADGEVVSSMHYQGEKLDVRVGVKAENLQDVDEFLRYPVGLSEGGEILLGGLLTTEARQSTANIRHYNFRRAVTVEADLDFSVTDTITATRAIQRGWRKIASDFPDISLDFSGEMDDVKESLGAMAKLFFLGVGLIYILLAVQFKSYIQPVLVLVAIPLAFTGVIFGLVLSNNPLSLFTLYGVIALAGIAANDAIVLISTANRHLHRGWSVSKAIVYAARRRVVPIVITSLTTMAGLVSLALGIGGESLIWGPVATAIVWGLGFSTLLTLFVVPLAYLLIIKSPDKGYVELGLTGTPLTSSGTFSDRRARAFNVRSEDKAISFSDSAQQILYEQGIMAFRDEDVGLSIKCFEQLAEMDSNVKTFNVLAAQALIRYMQEAGWDIGYIVRAKRYLERAKKIDPVDKQIDGLQRICAQLDEAAD